MRALIFTTLIAAPIMAGVAVAEEGRMSTLEFGRANRCLAYANLAALSGDPVDLSALQQRYEAALASRPHAVRQEANAEALRIRIAAQSATTERAIAALRVRRDRECRFVAGEMARTGDAPSGR